MCVRGGKILTYNQPNQQWEECIHTHITIADGTHQPNQQWEECICTHITIAGEREPTDTSDRRSAYALTSLPLIDMPETKVT